MQWTTSRGLLGGAGAVAMLAAALTSGRAAIVVAVANLGALLLVGGVRVAAALVSTPRPFERRHRDGSARQPFVSIHVPICDEPPGVVNRTLASLAQLRYPAYEVIVLDNNTSDPALWRPVERRCRALGHRFRFFHVDRLEGHKAGALELCRRLCADEAELLMTVDADYVVEPDIVSRALDYLGEDEAISHVQFPQAYFNGSPRARPLAHEYAHYFEAYLPFSDRLGAPLLTGTLSVVRRSALERVGGWSARTITEDAELGARLSAAGYRGRYAPIVAGRGMMPTDLGALRKQRRRWVHGNAQTLFGLRPRHWLSLGPLRGLAVLAQLTAWFNFLLVPLALLAAIGIGDLASHATAAAVCAATIGAAAVVHLAAFRLAIPHVERGPRTVLAALAIRMGLAWEGATAWIEALVGVPLGFVRTDKFDRLGTLRDCAPGLVAAAAMLLAAIGFGWRGAVWTAAACALAATGFGCVLYLRATLRAVSRAVIEAPALPPQIETPPFSPEERRL